ncbi:MAG TPA: matrixin family metalloprotease [Lacibacter sp.]|nr:matrixin family metalloprotease [Lacibacter sp.]HMO90426.1 matrixin family metalloprotease [Lacibacter sp.]
MRNLLPLLLLLAFVFTFPPPAAAQCTRYPVPLEQRVARSAYMVQGTVVEQQCYTDAATGHIYTRNTIRVNAWLKGHRADTALVVLTIGGVDGNRALVVEPSLELDLHRSYVLLLEADNRQVDDKQLRRSRPGLLQLLPYADAQGALVEENLRYHDLLYPGNPTEGELFARLQTLTGLAVRTPAGKTYLPREPLPEKNTGIARISSISSFTPTTTNAGTTIPGEFITITGTGFGATRGTGFVAFPNADDGGATTQTPPNASDYVSWSNTSITVKVPRRAGTGTITVTTNGGANTYTSASPLTIEYAHIEVNNNFLNFASNTRQRAHLRNLNTLGGYTFTYNTTFAANTAATASFQRALNTWRCATNVNFRIAATTTAIATAVGDGVNVVTFNTAIPAGVLARAFNYFNASGISGTCDLFNTVWWTPELDMEFNNPPFTGFTWQYGPAAPTGSQFDFETVAVHELGHLHGLGHIIAPGVVMHYALSNGIQSRTLQARDIAAGQAKMSYSTAATCFNPAAAGTPMVAISGACALPLSFLAFEGRRTGSGENLLEWTTAFEYNNRGFEVERSSNGTAFTKIGWVSGANGNNAESRYRFTDAAAGRLAWYYRLRQVDEDGRSQYSSTVQLRGTENAGWQVWAEAGANRLVVQGSTSAPFTLQLYNAGGQLLLSRTLSGSPVVVNTAGLPHGLCHYRVIQEGRTVHSGSVVLGGD